MDSNSESEQLGLRASLHLHGNIDEVVRKLTISNERPVAESKELVARNEELVQKSTQDIRALPEGSNDHTSMHQESVYQAHIRLPNEILHMIFTYAIPPSQFVDPSLCGGPESPWCLTLRTKKSLALVCKSWWGTAMDILYKEVVFRRPEQIPAFVHTLDTSMFDCRSSVRKVSVACFLNSDLVADLEGDLARIFSGCPQITELTWNPHFDDYETPDLLFTLQWALPLAIGLQAVSKTLVSFSLVLPPTAPDETPAVRLDRLENLHIEWLWKESTLQCITTHWSLPCLKIFAMTSRADPSTDRLIALRPSIVAFCQAHGQNIVYISIRMLGYPTTPRCRWSFYQPILDVCPNVRHLFINPSFSIPLTHPKIQWIDLESPFSPDCRFVAQFVTEFDLPSLKGVRTVDPALHAVAELARLVAPHYMLDKDADFEWRFPGVHVRHRQGRLYRADMEYYDGEDRASGTESDSH
ncbi:hypothetical protein PLICRDRAFT_170933 [Plicaturopsis crispa FD-325 SS-3]|nr:hypothetical protein PLICRDRAFT_170933 [Plicaturopsis crispa FD-325 SS-3]